jgi:hypothetical protein
MYSATFFPYSDASQRDPASGREEGLLENERAGRHRPKIFYTNSGVEYWGGGRAAALVHTTLDGHRDLTLPDNVRFYLFSGTQHSPAPFPPQMTTGQQPANPIEYWWSMRALLVAMEGWVREDAAPPASRYPRLADATLVTADRISFPTIPGVQSPRLIEPGRDGEARLPLLVTQVDADGNELGGIRAPDVAVPLATYTGWNFRSRETGAPDQLVALLGSSIPFPRTKADRETSGDPRRSIEERYSSRAAYLAEIRKVADGLVAGAYFLAEDVDDVVERAGAQWDLATAR